jgi:glycosyltransferase involved in cell wall biosynthesis
VKLLTFSTLYPDTGRPRHGIFVENRLRHLINGTVEKKLSSLVVAPVPWFPAWFPLGNRRFGDYADYAQVPQQEVRYGIDVLHPRYPLIPKLGMSLAPLLMALAMRPQLKRILAGGYDFDLIDAHYFYPDGVAAVLLGKMLHKPVVITARGSDLNLLSRYWLPRRMIQWAAIQAAGMITVCQALKDVLVSLGVEEKRVEVLRNGVDLELFRLSADRAILRAQLEIKGTTLLCVGHLIPLKGYDLVITALKSLPGVSLLIAGNGPERENLQNLAQHLGVSERVRFLGEVPHQQLADYYGSVDALVLASSREGWANVLLEAMACGTPVVATRVGGSPEVVAAPEAGVLVSERTPDALADGIRRLLAAYPERIQTRTYAEGFSWDHTTQGQLRLFERILETSPG